MLQLCCFFLVKRATWNPLVLPKINRLVCVKYHPAVHMKIRILIQTDRPPCGVTTLQHCNSGVSNRWPRTGWVFEVFTACSLTVREWPDIRRQDIGHSMYSNRPLQGHVSPAPSFLWTTSEDRNWLPQPAIYSPHSIHYVCVYMLPPSYLHLSFSDCDSVDVAVLTNVPLVGISCHIQTVEWSGVQS